VQNLARNIADLNFADANMIGRVSQKTPASADTLIAYATTPGKIVQLIQVI